VREMQRADADLRTARKYAVACSAASGGPAVAKAMESQIRYVRAREDAHLHGIRPGTYTLRFMLGVDWNDSGRVFRRDVESYAFVDTFDFTETTNDDRVVYSEQSVTLHK
jgi:hypothetical protein